MNRIIIYGTHTCPWCRKTEKYLTEKDIKYEYIDVEKDENASALIIEKTGQRGVPVLNINGIYIVGFNKTKIDENLK